MSTLPDKNENYKDVEYWDQRYETEDSYEWCKDYATFKNLINGVVRKEDRILVIGCGNSNLSLDLYNDGYLSITNIDYSSVVIDKMKSKIKSITNTMEGNLTSNSSMMKYEIMDMRNLEFPSNSFDVVIEKSTLDVLYTSEKSLWTISSETMNDLQNTLSSVKRVLSPNGRFISITFAEPYFRKKLYSQYWDSIKVQSFGDFFHYYFYDCCATENANVNSESTK